MRIGIDLDGVLIDLASVLFRRMAEDRFFVNTFSDEFDIWFERQVKSGIYSEPKVYPGAQGFLEKLKSEKDEIVIITARLKGKNSIPDTYDYLRLHNLIFDEIHFTQQKWLVNCDLYLDDDPRIVKNMVKNKRDVLVPLRPWNFFLNCDFYHDFEDALKKIEERRSLCGFSSSPSPFGNVNSRRGGDSFV